MARRNAILDRARQQIEQQMKIAEDERRKKLMQKRLEFISNGIKASQKKKYAEAVGYFQAFIKLLEEVKGVKEGGLTPKNFDPAKELSDMLMLSGVYWDLARIFDRTATADKAKLFQHYLEKFILFSRGMSWQPLSAEQIRRYLLANRPKHRAEFRSAFRLIGKDKCFIVSAVSDEADFETIPTLREFRDQTLARFFMGRILIRGYYRVGPVLANVVIFAPRPMRVGMARSFDQLARVLRK